MSIFSLRNAYQVHAGPYDFCSETDIDADPADLFALVDITGTRYWRYALGDRIERISATQYLRADVRTPDIEMHVDVVDREPNHVIELAVLCNPTPTEWSASYERYAIEVLPNGRCRLTLTVAVTPSPSLSRMAFHRAKAVFTLAMFNTVDKIRILAEEGKDALCHADRRLIVNNELAAY